MNNDLNIKFSTNVELKDLDTGEILVNDCNAVHPANMAYVIARGLANESDHSIFKVGLGNGGTYTSSDNTIHFNNPNVVGLSAALYNETYFEEVDDSGNSVTAARSTSDTTSIVTVSMVMASNEPGTSNPNIQWTSDAQGSAAGTLHNPQDPNAIGSYAFEFDELGCFAINPFYDPLDSSKGPEYLLLTHIIFHPIAKTQNRQIQLTYSITISVS